MIARRFIATSDSTAQVVLAQQAHALGFAVVVVGAVAILGGAVRPENLTAIGLGSAVASGVLYYAGAYWLYLTALRRVPASLAAVSFYLIPIFGVAAGFLLLGERLDTRQLVGAGIVLVSLLLIIRRPAARSQPEAAAVRPT